MLACTVSDVLQVLCKWEKMQAGKNAAGFCDYEITKSNWSTMCQMIFETPDETAQQNSDLNVSYYKWNLCKVFAFVRWRESKLESTINKDTSLGKQQTHLQLLAGHRLNHKPQQEILLSQCCTPTISSSGRAHFRPVLDISQWVFCNNGYFFYSGVKFLFDQRAPVTKCRSGLDAVWIFDRLVSAFFWILWMNDSFDCAAVMDSKYVTWSLPVQGVG